MVIVSSNEIDPNGFYRKAFMHKDKPEDKGISKEVVTAVSEEAWEDKCPRCGSDAVGFSDGQNECFTCNHKW